MNIDEALNILKRDRDLCNFNPVTGECEPMDEGCRQSVEAYNTILQYCEQRNTCQIIDKLKQFIKSKWIDGDCRRPCLFCPHWKECRYDLGFPSKYDKGLEKGYDLGYLDGLNDAKKK